MAYTMDSKTKHVHATAGILFSFFYLHFVAGDSPPAYKPFDNIVVDCGSFGNSSVFGDPRTWVGDINSKFFPFNYNRNGESIDSSVMKQFHSIPQPPFISARLSNSEFTYFFSVSPGQKFIRLYFFSAPYLNFDRSKAFFSVRVGLYTLLRDFNASVNADASGWDEISREYCVNVEGNQLNITFIPSNQDSYAFICGIEIVSMPVNLYYTPPEPHQEGGRGLKLVDQNNKLFAIENYTSLEMVYRINVGGNFISPVVDTGMFRTWSRDRSSFDSGHGYIPVNTTIHLDFTEVPNYSAPENVYRTSWRMGPNATVNKSFNLTWAYSVNPGFYYMLRLHFCEYEAEINAVSDRVFLIYIADMIAEMNADVFRWAGGKGIPYFRDYIVFVPFSDHQKQKKTELSVKLQASPDDFRTRYSNVLLNGIEIFKLNDSDGNLGGQNPDLPPTIPSQSPSLLPVLQPRNANGKTLAITMSVMVCVVVVMLTLGLFLVLQCKTFRKESSSGKTSWRALYSIWKDKSSKTRNSNLPYDLCRYFSLVEIKYPTRDFDEVFIIGVGGFGNVYKGYIDDGATQVAIKRLKPGSKQGNHEFRTEIKMLSQLRHLHLVPLIGYCNEGSEMILVYDYMSRGTLQSHLYGYSDERQPLPWKQRLQICIGAAKGLHYLHTGAKHTIIHRDIKTTNILLDDKWVAKVSDFGLSKVGSTTILKDYVTTMVKGSFGYLDPEYCRRLQLSEKSDVYSFGVVLCEVLCACPPLMCTDDKMHLLLVEWVKRCIHENIVTQIIDPKMKDEITFECFRKFIQIVVSCIEDEGVKRPSMNDVVRGLEFAFQLQESLNYKNVELSSLDNADGWLFEEGMSSNKSSSFVCDKGMSGIVFSELKDLEGR